MRRWLAILLLVLLPTQWAWGALAPLCGDELSHAVTQSAGEQSHDHDADSADGADPTQHGDCLHCHHGHGHGLGVVATASALALTSARGPHGPPVPGRLPDSPSSPPDRPPWPRPP